MSDEELIARLRDIQGQAGLFTSAAADRIEALTKDAKAHEKEIAVWFENYAAVKRKLTKLEEQQDRLGHQCVGLAQAGMKVQADLDAERAKVAKLVEALEYYAGRVTYRLCDDCPVQVHKSADLSGPARAALAEIKGDKHDDREHDDDQ